MTRNEPSSTPSHPFSNLVCGQGHFWPCMSCGPTFPKQAYTLPKKKHNFNFQIFYGDHGSGSVTPGQVHLAQSPPAYTLHQKIDNFRKVALLLGKSVVASYNALYFRHKKLSRLSFQGKQAWMK